MRHAGEIAIVTARGRSGARGMATSEVPAVDDADLEVSIASPVDDHRTA